MVSIGKATEILITCLNWVSTKCDLIIALIVILGFSQLTMVFVVSQIVNAIYKLVC